MFPQLTRNEIHKIMNRKQLQEDRIDEMMRLASLRDQEQKIIKLPDIPTPQPQRKTKKKQNVLEYRYDRQKLEFNLDIFPNLNEDDIIEIIRKNLTPDSELSLLSSLNEAKKQPRTN